ncbi:S1 family peptidase [Aliagarivorans marinus]|uniref:S1 family peptidase n=1 Tax=Aliagarivorans marinus TaxID=561965 RepID=UPI0004262FA3|nr:serine protease [Aliagarivorans marinus]
MRVRFIVLLLACFCLQSVAGEKQARIIDGDEADTSHFPFFVKIFAYGGTHLQCGGVLLSPEWVLTAGHCVTNDGNRKAYPADDIRVSLEIRTYETSEESKEFVEEVYIHPNYQPSDGSKTTVDRDLALLKLKQAQLDFDPSNFPTLLDVPVPESFLVVQDKLTAIGFGSTTGREDFTSPSALMQIDAPLISNQECSLVANQVTDTMVCTLDESKSICAGDSGGPLLWGEPGSYHVVGISSWAPCECDEGLSGYADVGSMSPWLRQVMSGEGIEPDSVSGQSSASGGNGGGSSGGSTGLLLSLILAGTLLVQQRLHLR